MSAASNAVFLVGYTIPVKGPQHTGHSIPADTAYVSIRQHSSAYASIRHHTSAYVSVSSIPADTACRTTAYRPSPCCRPVCLQHGPCRYAGMLLTLEAGMLLSLTYADKSWHMLTYAYVRWRMLTYADVCSQAYEGQVGREHTDVC